MTPIYLAPSLQIDLSPHRGQFRGFWAKSGPETHRTGPRKVKEGYIYIYLQGPPRANDPRVVQNHCSSHDFCTVSANNTLFCYPGFGKPTYIYIYTFIHTRAHTRGRGLAHPADRPILICMKTMRHVCIYIYSIYIYIRRTNDLSTDSGQVALSRKPSQQARKQPTAHARRTPTST